MHELSIANSLVEIAAEHAGKAGATGIRSITLWIGALSCVHESALRYSFDLVTEGTLLEGAKLKIVNLPVMIFCATCNKETELPGIQRFRCPVCDEPSDDIRQGRELDLESIEIVENEEAEVSHNA